MTKQPRSSAASSRWRQSRSIPASRAVRGSALDRGGRSRSPSGTGRRVADEPAGELSHDGFRLGRARDRRKRAGRCCRWKMPGFQLDERVEVDGFPRRMCSSGAGRWARALRMAEIRAFPGGGARKRSDLSRGAATDGEGNNDHCDRRTPLRPHHASSNDRPERPHPGGSLLLAQQSTATDDKTTDKADLSFPVVCPPSSAVR